MNTLICYNYEDTRGFTVHNWAIVKGEITEAEKQTIFDCSNGSYFVPAQVELPENRFEQADESDQAWFKLESFEISSGTPTVSVDVHTLVRNFEEARDNWDETFWTRNWKI